MQERWITVLFFIAGVLAGVLGMRLLGLRSQPTVSAPRASAPASERLNLGAIGLRLPEGDQAQARDALQQGLQLGQLYQQFAREESASEPLPVLPTLPAYNPPAPPSAPLPASQPADVEPLQPLQPSQPALRQPARAPLFAIPPAIRDAFRGGYQEEQLR